jgi:hypothetical protein
MCLICAYAIDYLPTWLEWPFVGFFFYVTHLLELVFKIFLFFINFHWSWFFVVRINFIIGTHTLELFIQGENMKKYPKNSPYK